MAVAGVDLPAVQAMTAFVTASLAGIASLLPGGAGVFDGVLLLSLHTAGTSSDALVAGIVIFRIVYYIVPWLVEIYLGGAALTADENAPLGALLQQWPRNPLLAPLRLPLVLFSAIAVRALAYLTFAAGVVLLVSSALPGPADLQLTGVPMSLPEALLVEGVHLGSVFVGVTLLILAGGIVRQVESVYRIVIPVLLCGALLVLLTDVHHVQAGFLAALAGLLRMQRRRFYRRVFPVLSRRTARWLLATLVSLRSLPVVTVGCCWLRRPRHWVIVHVRSCILPTVVPGIRESVPDSLRENKHLKLWHGACSFQDRHGALEQGAVMSDTNPIIALGDARSRLPVRGRRDTDTYEVLPQEPGVSTPTEEEAP
jgi:phosphatidylglycerol lysyltransferase